MNVSDCVTHMAYTPYGM